MKYKLKYVKVYSNSKPDPIEIGLTTIYIRKNITETAMELENGETTIKQWEYQEAAILKEDFEQISGALLLSGQNSSAVDQMTIMEAIADLYETMAAMS